MIISYLLLIFDRYHDARWPSSAEGLADIPWVQTEWVREGKARSRDHLCPKHSTRNFTYVFIQYCHGWTFRGCKDICSVWACQDWPSCWSHDWWDCSINDKKIANIILRTGSQMWPEVDGYSEPISTKRYAWVPCLAHILMSAMSSRYGLMDDGDAFLCLCQLHIYHQVCIILNDYSSQFH